MKNKSWLLLAVTLAFAVAAPVAQADGGDEGAAAALGFLLGTLVTQPTVVYGAPPTVYEQPGPVVVQPPTVYYNDYPAPPRVTYYYYDDDRPRWHDGWHRREWHRHWHHDRGRHWDRDDH